MKRRIPKNYINNKDLFNAMVDFTTSRKEAIKQEQEVPPIPKYVAECIWLIATRLATKPCFSGYSFIDEMVGDGVENCIMYIHNFNPEKSNNPFGYVTLIIKNAFLRRIEKESKQSYIRHKMMIQGSHINHAQYGSDHSHSEVDSITNMSNDTSYGIIDKFETKLRDKKQAKIDKQKEKDNDID